MAPDLATLREDADGRLKRLSRYICRFARDSLPDLWTGRLEVWDEASGAWRDAGLVG